MVTLNAAEWSLLIIVGVIALVKLFNMTSVLLKERKKRHDKP